MKRLLLINPELPRRKRALAGAKYWGMPPLGLSYVAAVTPQDWTIRIIDEHIESIPDDEKPDLVGITAITQNVPRAYKIAAAFRAKGVRTVLGGIHPSMVPDEAVQHADAVVIGEAEWIWKQVISDFESGALQATYAGERGSLDEIPAPRRDLLSKRYMVGTMNAARGCPFGCEFCSVTAFNGGTYRKRKVEGVLDEIAQVPQATFYFVDDNLYGSGKAAKQWLTSLCQGLIDRGIRKTWASQVGLDFSEDDEILRLAYQSGCRGVYIGFESIDHDALGEMHKAANIRIGPEKYAERIAKIHRAGIAVVGSFIVGSSQDDVKSFKKLNDFLNASGIDAPALQVLTPLPGTVLWTRMQSENRIIYRSFPDDWVYFDNTHVVTTPYRMSVDELVSGYNYLVLKQYSRMRIARRFFGTLINTRSLRSSVLAYARNKGIRALKVCGKDFDSLTEAG